MKGSKPKDNEGNSSSANPDDEEYGFMDMVVSTRLKRMSTDYSRYSEDKPKFSGSKNQGRFGLGLSLYRSTGT